MYYSADFRKRTLEYTNTHTLHETADIFGISVSTISQWKKLIREGKSLEYAYPPRKPRKLDHTKLIEYVNANPDKYLREIAEVFNVSESAIGRALEKLGFTLKKRPNYTRNGMRRGERITKKKYQGLSQKK